MKRWIAWRGRNGYERVSVDGVPSQAKLTLTRFNGNKSTVMDLPVDDVEIYEIRTLLACWLYDNYGQDMDDLHKRHKERFGHWYEDEKYSNLVHDDSQKGGADHEQETRQASN